MSDVCVYNLLYIITLPISCVKEAGSNCGLDLRARSCLNLGARRHARSVAWWPGGGPGDPGPPCGAKMMGRRNTRGRQ